MIDLEWAMNEHDFTVSAMQGEMDLIKRDKIMKEFRIKANGVLITTDLFVRGIDV